ncbi:helix-turn-helix domain-containing protein, partial [Pseudoalteromonas sp. S3776]|uniref:helix-turn-helix domain-containing protein n=1 Tax=Pseudoalteromonas sp. S3776 TaxID=579544 RepID=UPI00110825FE
MAYTHLSSEERHYIETELKNGVSQNQIAKKLGRTQPTVSREISRNKGLRGYSHQQAHRTAQQRHQEKLKAVKLTEEIKRRISDDISCGDWSPEQVAGRLEKEGII